MRVSKYLLLIAAFAMMLPVGAAARSNNERTVHLASPALVGSQQLAPGSYKVEWQGNGPAVNVQFIKNNKTVATTQGHWVTESNAAPYDSVVLKKTSNNQNRLFEIDFHNNRQVLQIGPSTSNRTGM